MGETQPGLSSIMKDTREDAELDPLVIAAIARGVFEIKGDRITYNTPTKKTYDWNDPEEWVRARTLAFLVLKKSYPLNRIRIEVPVPRRTPGDYAVGRQHLSDRMS
jgi:type I restriction enzyme M protein